jgi:hypothetical protein
MDAKGPHFLRACPLLATRFVWTALSVETCFRNYQPFHNRLACDVLINDFIHVRQCDSSIPNRLRINHHSWTVLALIKASSFVSTDLAFESAFCQSRLECLVQFSVASGIA